MSRMYEAVYILDSTLEEDAITEKLNKHHELVPQASGEPIALDMWGKRTMAYPIANKETGFYVIAKFEATPEMLPEFERALKLDEGVLRHLIVLDEGAVMSTAPSDRDGEDD
ncbi:MAG: 30S ribosomal protein S6 [Gemmatimonadetes bacterium]|nr:30S ribosomal protein S6 [Gemmatimonadota bacterium]MCB9505487.1 30S ribosomal protein S6 [Gemmatimonadales bacterium]MCA9762690.1 30S ribosomal protein S6 [Gemmatimonadota bacterium]MCA9767488.1 30S ribosomal protein S6 [Gemmatimonadota bacterium]HPF62114.1 30S ribosomal protein S6 [Gemmatimonadales bacterium]